MVPRQVPFLGFIKGLWALWDWSFTLLRTQKSTLIDRIGEQVGTETSPHYFLAFSFSSEEGGTYPRCKSASVPIL